MCWIFLDVDNTSFALAKIKSFMLFCFANSHKVYIYQSLAFLCTEIHILSDTISQNKYMFLILLVRINTVSLFYISHSTFYYFVNTR
jgi:hypothetical protein